MKGQQMPTRTKTIDRDYVRTVAAWPTIAELAEEWGVPARFIRGAVERGRVRAARVDHFRVDPESFERFLADRLADSLPPTE